MSAKTDAQAFFHPSGFSGGSSSVEVFDISYNSFRHCTTCTCIYADTQSIILWNVALSESYS